MGPRGLPEASGGWAGAVQASAGQTALALALLFAWLLCLPLAGPLLARAAPPGLGPLSAAQSFALAHALSLLLLGLLSVRLSLGRLLPWLGATTGALGLALAALPASWWAPLLVAAGATSAAGVLAIGGSLASMGPRERPWCIALGALLANLPLYLVGLPEASWPERPLALLLALGPLALPWLLRGQWERKEEPGRPLAWQGLLPLLPAVFCVYLVGGLMYSLVLPTLGGLGMRLGVLPYMALLPAAAWATAHLGRDWPGRAGPALLGLGFLGWALLSGPGRDACAQALVVGGYAFTDVFFWSAFAEREERPALAFGLGLGTMVLAIFGGLALSPWVAELAAAREEAAALVATAALLVAAVLFPLWRGAAAPAGPAGAPIALDGWGLSGREREVLALVARGLSNKEVARSLGVSPHTVRKLLERAYRKMGVGSRTEAMSLLRCLAEESPSPGEDGERRS